MKLFDTPFLALLLLPLLISCNGSSENTDKSDSHIYLPDAVDFPRVLITTENSQEVRSKENYIDGNIEILGAGEFDDFSTEIEIRGRGNSTWSLPKKPYQVKFTDKDKFLDMPKDKKWIFLSNYSDKSLLRNELAFDLGRLSNLDWTPDSRFAELVINDQYRGLYQITQKVEESSRRVDIGDDGFLLEVDQLDRLDLDDVYFETRHHLINIKEPDLSYDDEKYTYISSHIQEIEDALTSDDFLDSSEGYANYIDIDSVIDWYLINEIAKNQDAVFFSSVYMSLIPGEKLKMGPIWDFDIGFGNNSNTKSDAYDPEGFWVKRSAWISRMFKDPAFIAKLKERFTYFYENRTVLSDKVIANSNYIMDAQVRNYTKWQTLGTYVWPNYVYFDTYEEEKEYLLQWLDDRFEWLNSAINEL